MSASEKLKALDAEMRVFDAGLKELKILEALPQIVAVVEDYEKLPGRSIVLIAALEEALGE